MGRKLADKEVVGSKGLARVAEVIAALVPFVSYPWIEWPSFYTAPLQLRYLCVVFFCPTDHSTYSAYVNMRRNAQG